MEIKVNIGDVIGYISVHIDRDGKEQYEFFSSKVTKITIQKKGITVNAKDFRTLNYEELMRNTEFMDGADEDRSLGLILVREPFICSNKKQIGYYKKLIERWNKEGAESLFEN